MRPTVGLCLLAALSVASTPLEATSQVSAQTHIAHVMSGFPGAPNGAALLAVAEADAAMAVEHARLAGSDRTDIGPMVRHARHVLHTLDASAIASGPGSGFGVGPAADAIAQHIELAAQAEGASEGVRQHAAHVATAARAVSARATAMREVANQIVRTSDYVAAFDLVRQLQRLAGQLVSGADSSGDGSIALAEGGLEHVRTHMGLMTSSAAR
ncbi:MAG: hypothetical protein EXR91_05280 [Gemmatimonadetes bacterium]|nr:hypothetical protein [Gemmatimonadota bacterium]